MDQVIFDQKLESLRRCIRRLEEKTPSHVSQLIEDQDIQDILVLNLTRAVQLCVDIGSHVISESEEQYPLPWAMCFRRWKILVPLSRLPANL